MDAAVTVDDAPSRQTSRNVQELSKFRQRFSTGGDCWPRSNLLEDFRKGEVRRLRRAVRSDAVRLALLDAIEALRIVGLRWQLSAFI